MSRRQAELILESAAVAALFRFLARTFTPEERDESQFRTTGCMFVPFWTHPAFVEKESQPSWLRHDEIEVEPLRKFQ
jgi:hypothetical protein